MGLQGCRFGWMGLHRAGCSLGARACELLHAVRREEVLLAVPPRRRAPLGALRRAPAFEGAQQPQLVRHLAKELRVRPLRLQAFADAYSPISQMRAGAREK